jgi:hypothetical protein
MTLEATSKKATLRKALLRPPQLLMLACSVILPHFMALVFLAFAMAHLTSDLLVHDSLIFNRKL